jgi:hypothetical protein
MPTVGIVFVNGIRQSTGGHPLPLGKMPPPS